MPLCVCADTQSATLAPNCQHLNSTSGVNILAKVEIELHKLLEMSHLENRPTASRLRAPRSAMVHFPIGSRTVIAAMCRAEWQSAVIAPYKTSLSVSNRNGIGWRL